MVSRSTALGALSSHDSLFVPGALARYGSILFHGALQTADSLSFLDALGSLGIDLGFRCPHGFCLDLSPRCDRFLMSRFYVQAHSHGMARSMNMALSRSLTRSTFTVLYAFWSRSCSLMLFDTLSRSHLLAHSSCIRLERFPLALSFVLSRYDLLVLPEHLTRSGSMVRLDLFLPRSGSVALTFNLTRSGSMVPSQCLDFASAQWRARILWLSHPGWLDLHQWRSQGTCLDPTEWFPRR
jgi:hypothetical protein